MEYQKSEDYSSFIRKYLPIILLNNFICNCQLVCIFSNFCNFESQNVLYIDEEK